MIITQAYYVPGPSVEEVESVEAVAGGTETAPFLFKLDSADIPLKEYSLNRQI